MASTAGTQQAPSAATQTTPQASTGSWVVSNGKWLAGYAAMWIILEGMVDAGLGEIAAALAVVAVGSSFIAWGPKAIDNLTALAGGKKA